MQALQQEIITGLVEDASAETLSFEKIFEVV